MKIVFFAVVAALTGCQAKSSESFFKEASISKSSKDLEEIGVPSDISSDIQKALANKSLGATAKVLDSEKIDSFEKLNYSLASGILALKIKQDDDTQEDQDKRAGYTNVATELPGFKQVIKGAVHGNTEDIHYSVAADFNGKKTYIQGRNVFDGKQSVVLYIEVKVADGVRTDTLVSVRYEGLLSSLDTFKESNIQEIKVEKIDAQ